MDKMKPAKLRIAELRVKHDRMTQAELAQQTGLSKATISNLESGHLKRIELATISKLCRALQCTPNDILALPEESEIVIARNQRDALKKLLGSMRFDKAIDTRSLDQDLAKMTGKRIKQQVTILSD